MKVCFDGVGQELVTFLETGGLKEGQVCIVTANGTVGACSASDRFCGVVSHVDKGLAAVQVRGYVETQYSGDTAPTVGYCALAADGEGGVTASGTVTYLVICVDTAAKTVGFVL